MPFVALIFLLFLLALQVGHKADEAGEGPESSGAAGGGRRPAGVQGEGRGDGRDDRGAPGQSACIAEGE